MTTIYMRSEAKHQIVKLSDGSRGIVDTKMVSDGTRYQFWFMDHRHLNFWWNRPITDGQTIRVASIDGPESFQIALS